MNARGIARIGIVLVVLEGAIGWGGSAIAGASQSEAFRSSYGLFVSRDAGHCIYWLTDAGIDARQLRLKLAQEYDHARGLEVLTDPHTSRRCAERARRVAIAAGFRNVRIRLAEDKDRMPGIP